MIEINSKDPSNGVLRKLNNNDLTYDSNLMAMISHVLNLEILIFHKTKKDQ